MLLKAFVALVLPFDSFRRLQGQTLRPFFAGWGMSRRLGEPRGTDQEKQSNFNSRSFRSVKRTRDGEVVQCFEGLWVHPAANGRRCFRALLRNHDGRLQVPERRASGGV